MTHRILILIGGHLCTSPRSQKEATALAQAGYSVTVTGKWDDPVHADWDMKIAASAPYSYIPAIDMRPQKKFQRFFARLERHLASLLNHPFLLGYGCRALLRVAHRHQADLTIGHCESSLAILLSLSRRGMPVALDFEDWFSRNIPSTQHFQKRARLLESLERGVVATAEFTTCPTECMAIEIEKTYENKKPIPISNAFPPPSKSLKLPDAAPQGDPPAPLRVIWFSQTLGRGRGLEALFEALHDCMFPITLTLIGRCSHSMREYVEQCCPVRPDHTVSVLSPVPPWELPAIVASHDVGLALETNEIINHGLTASNKYYQYLAAGIAILATDTRGQMEVWSQEHPPGLRVAVNSASALTKALQRLHSDRALLLHCRQNAIQLALQYAPANSSNDRIVALVESALRKTSPARH